MTPGHPDGTMTSAHIFYIPVIFFVGLLAGYFVGENAAERRLKKRREKLRRRRAAQRDHSEEKLDEEAN